MHIKLPPRLTCICKSRCLVHALVDKNLILVYVVFAMHVCGHAQQDPYTFQCAMTMHIRQTAQDLAKKRMSLNSILGVIMFIVLPTCQGKYLY